MNRLLIAAVLLAVSTAASAMTIWVTIKSPA